MKLSQLTVLGSHDSMTYKLKFPMSVFAKCQNLTLEEQLDLGVKYFDIRLNYIDSCLRCYHGISDCKITWVECLNIFNNWIIKNPNEFILLRVIRADDQTGKQNISDEQWVDKFYTESNDIVVTDRDLDESEIKGRIIVTNLNWRMAIPSKMTNCWSLNACEKDVTKLINECNVLSEDKSNQVKLIYTNSDGSIKMFNKIPLLNKIPYPKAFFNILKKRINEINIVPNNGNWYIFDFVDEIPKEIITKIKK